MSGAERLPIMRPEVLPTDFERALASEAGEEDDEALTEEERYFAERARAANTRRAYRADRRTSPGGASGKGVRPCRPARRR